MKTRPLLAGLAFAVAILSTTFQAQAAVSIAYSNGATNGTLSPYPINNEFSVSDSFTLADSAKLNGASVGIWTRTGDYLTSVDWAITSTAFGSVLASGTASSITNTYFGTFLGLYDINDASFEITSPILSAGTYYFQLSNAVLANSVEVYWDTNSGSSTAFQSSDGGVNSGPIASQAFTLTAVPEASSACLGLLGATGLLIRRRRGA
jgi:hypothetical protein